MSVTQAATRSGFTRRYINAEIKAGRLIAERVGNQHIIEGSDFELWMRNPRRGSRTKNSVS